MSQTSCLLFTWELRATAAVAGVLKTGRPCGRSPCQAQSPRSVSDRFSLRLHPPCDLQGWSVSRSRKGSWHRARPPLSHTPAAWGLFHQCPLCGGLGVKGKQGTWPSTWKTEFAGKYLARPAPLRARRAVGSPRFVPQLAGEPPVRTVPPRCRGCWVVYRPFLNTPELASRL